MSGKYERFENFSKMQFINLNIGEEYLFYWR